MGLIISDAVETSSSIGDAIMVIALGSEQISFSFPDIPDIFHAIIVLTFLN